MARGKVPVDVQLGYRLGLNEIQRRLRAAKNDVEPSTKRNLYYCRCDYLIYSPLYYEPTSHKNYVEASKFDEIEYIRFLARNAVKDLIPDADSYHFARNHYNDISRVFTVIPFQVYTAYRRHGSVNERRLVCQGFLNVGSNHHAPRVTFKNSAGFSYHRKVEGYTDLG